MNEFLKFERDISMPNAFIITEALRRQMDPTSDCFSRFTDTKRRRVILANGVSVTTYPDERHPPSIPESPRRFKVWLDSKELPQPSRNVNHIKRGWKVGDSILCDTAHDLSGYRYIELLRVEEEWKPASLGAEFERAWSVRAEELSRHPGIKASVTRVLSPVTDDPRLRIWWQPIQYYKARAFHGLVEEDSAAWLHFSRVADELDPRSLPSNLVTHSVVVTAPEGGTRHIVMAHRTKGARPAGYCNNQWSVSFEEQFAPVESEWGGKLHPADESLYSTVVRGLKEEFLGEHYTASIRVTFHALQVEVPNLNVGLVGLVELPNTTFNEVGNLWRAAVDTGEHDAIAGIPLDETTLKKCMQSAMLPGDVWDAAPKAGRTAFSPEDHRWHHTSCVRLAMCVWLLECASESVSGS